MQQPVYVYIYTHITAQEEYLISKIVMTITSY